jgi:hypothetical protein
MASHTMASHVRHAMVRHALLARFVQTRAQTNNCEFFIFAPCKSGFLPTPVSGGLASNTECRKRAIRWLHYACFGGLRPNNTAKAETKQGRDVARAARENALRRREQRGRRPFPAVPPIREGVRRRGQARCACAAGRGAPARRQPRR